MSRNGTFWAHVDEEGRLVLPPEMIASYGLQPGAPVCIDPIENGLSLRRPVTHLARVYVEPTNQCNLACRTCIRNTWDEPMGRMTDATFGPIIEGLRAFSPPPTVFFGGFGEPLSHPHIAEMVDKAKSVGAWVELITNGTLLSEDLFSTFHPAPFAAAVRWPRATKRIALATPSPRAAAACGRRA